ncbi:hypothetical protein [Microvirga pakistanensis]|uniref:hypothetical protein n=1 Tax=Microvirga pakistanensis TaxID=1682650 RepID=UPI00106C5917|nr:hypothetical protein [Microvirga pakistanensis]
MILMLRDASTRIDASPSRHFFASVGKNFFRVANRREHARETRSIPLARGTFSAQVSGGGARAARRSSGS